MLVFMRVSHKLLEINHPEIPQRETPLSGLLDPGQFAECHPGIDTGGRPGTPTAVSIPSESHGRGTCDVILMMMMMCSILKFDKIPGYGKVSITMMMVDDG